jgi:hypothetical protein
MAVSARSGCYRTFGVVAILSDGNPVFHSTKIDQN